MENAEVLIDCHSVWKVFGERNAEAIEAITAQGLSKRDILRDFGCVVGVSDASLQVHRGEIFCIMGLSGSGKSTLIRLLNRLIEPSLGTVLVKGQDISKMDAAALRRTRAEHIGMVFQSVALLPQRNVLENAAFGLEVQGIPRDERNRAAADALAKVGLSDWTKHYPSELSGGMQQRVGLARAMCTDPPILLMDEAFSALDPLIRRQMQDELLEIQEQVHKTILFITHDLNEALRLGNRVCILRDGYVVQIGTPEEILTEPANGYVAEFVQDVDQGRVIDVATVMGSVVVLDPDQTLASALDAVGDRRGGFTIDADGRPVSLLAVSDAGIALAHGTTALKDVLRTDFETTTAESRLNDNYAAAGRGMPIAVIDEAGRLVGELEPREIMEEMGRVEQLIDGFEREGFL